MELGKVFTCTQFVYRFVGQIFANKTAGVNSALTRLFKKLWTDFELLPRDAMRKRGLCCRPVSACLSVTLVHSIHTAEVIVKLLCRPGSLTPHATPSNSKGNAFSGGTKYKGIGKFFVVFFSTEIAVDLGKIRDRPMVAMER